MTKNDIDDYFDKKYLIIYSSLEKCWLTIYLLQPFITFIRNVSCTGDLFITFLWVLMLTSTMSNMTHLTIHVCILKSIELKALDKRKAKM